MKTHWVIRLLSAITSAAWSTVLLFSLLDMN